MGNDDMNSMQNVVSWCTCQALMVDPAGVRWRCAYSMRTAPQITE